MVGHAQLKFVMTECSKTQIRLTGLIFSCVYRNVPKFLNRQAYLTGLIFSCVYRNVPKFLNRQAYANDVDPDQAAARGAV